MVVDADIPLNENGNLTFLDGQVLRLTIHQAQELGISRQLNVVQGNFSGRGIDSHLIGADLLIVLIHKLDGDRLSDRPSGNRGRVRARDSNGRRGVLDGVGKASVTIGGIGRTVLKALLFGIQSDLISKRIGFGAGLLVDHRLYIGQIPGKALAVIGDSHIRLVTDGSPIQCDILAHCISHGACLCGNQDRLGNTFKSLSQVRNLCRGQVVAITLTGNISQRVLGMLRRAVIILGIPQIDSVDLMPGILGNLGLGNGRLTMVGVERGSQKIPLIAMDTSGDYGTQVAACHIGITCARPAYLTGVVKAGPAPVTQLAAD